MSHFERFASALNYPEADLAQQLDDCISALVVEMPLAAECVRKFQQSYINLGTSRLQEIYAATFDMRPECTLNLSYHLFGEDQRRGLFLAKLSELYQQAGIQTGKELPDHLCLLLSYLASEPGTAVKADLSADCLIPAISKIIHGMETTSNPYRELMTALVLVLEKDCGGTDHAVPKRGNGMQSKYVESKASL